MRAIWAFVISVFVVNGNEVRFKKFAKVSRMKKAESIAPRIHELNSPKEMLRCSLFWYLLWNSKRKKKYLGIKTTFKASKDAP